MKKILIDTDIGIDCDDAAALAVAIALEKLGKVCIEGVSTCTAREGASGSVKAILKYYGLNKDCASFMGEPLECDKTNVYAKGVKDAFCEKDCEEESVHLLRRKLAVAEEKVSIIALGPLSVIAGLLESQPDDLSSLNGVELVKEKVDTLYTMAGNFVKYHEQLYQGRFTYSSEWNVYQDIKSAQTVANICPVPIVFCPYEVGEKVLFGEPFAIDTPVGLSIRMFHQTHKHVLSGENTRSSWDPITVCVACGLDLFDFSPYGKITVDDDGFTHFEEGKGEHRYIIERLNPEETAKKINELYAVICNE